MRKIGRYVLFVLLLLSLTGCGKQGAEQQEVDKIKIGISVYNQHDIFISELLESIEESAIALEEKHGVTITLDIRDAALDQRTQNEQMEDFVDRGCDIVCINLVDRTDASMIIEKAKSNDVPVIFFNRELVEEDLERWKRTYYVGAIAEESGVMQGEIMNEILQENFDQVDTNQDGVIQYVMLEGEAGHQDSIIRTMSVVNTVSEQGYAIEKLSNEIANWDRDQAKTKMAQWILEYGAKIEVVFANNDGMALGALDALEDVNYQHGIEYVSPVILGIDGTREAIQAIAEGKLHGTVINDHKSQAEAMMALAYSIVLEQPLSSEFELENDRYIRCPYEKYSKQ